MTGHLHIWEQFVPIYLSTYDLIDEIEICIPKRQMNQTFLWKINEIVLFWCLMSVEREGAHLRLLQNIVFPILIR